MAFTKALYYPSIEIRDEEWLKTAVLFWDEISTIVPESLHNPYFSRTSKYLVDEGILTPVIVNSDRQLIQDLTEDTLKYINSNEGFQLLTNESPGQVIHREKLPPDVGRLFDVHPEKLPHQIRYMLENHLEGDFLRVDSGFALFYMTLLANKICENRGVALLSDNPLTSNFSDKLRLDNQISISNGSRRDRYEYDREFRGRDKYIFLAQGMLTNLIIESVKVGPGTSLADIVSFKKQQTNRDALGLFRTKIADLTKAVQTEGNYQAITQQVHDIYNNEFLPVFNNLKKSLDGSKVKWTSDNFMKVAFISTTSTALPIALLGASLPQALLAAAGISLVSSYISYNQDKEQKLRENPYSYLLTVQKHL